MKTNPQSKSAGSPGSRALGQDFNSYKPSTSNYKQVHKDLIVIDSCTNLIGLDKDPQYIDWYKQGGNTAIAISVSFGPMSAVSSVSDKMQTLDQMGFMHKLFHKRDDLILVRTTADILRAKQEGKLGIKSGQGFYDYGGVSREEVLRKRDLYFIRQLKLIREVQAG
mgnify:CR=1 FL=1